MFIDIKTQQNIICLNPLLRLSSTQLTLIWVRGFLGVRSEVEGREGVNYSQSKTR